MEAAKLPQSPDAEGRVAIVPGSFDPITLGHVDLIARAARLFDTVWAVAMDNPEKEYLFSSAQRQALMEQTLGHLPNVHVAYWDGMLYEYARETGACAVVKGIRNAADTAYELWQARYNSEMCPAAETIFLPASEQLEAISASEVKRRWEQGQPLQGLVPDAVLAALMQMERKESKHGNDID